MVYHGMPWYTMAYYGILWYTMVYYGPPCTCLAVSCDPELAIAKAKASQDHNKHRREIGPRILILNYSQSQSGP